MRRIKVILNIKKIISISFISATVLSTQLIADYHAMINNQQKGPFSTTQLQKMTNDGTISSNTLVWQSGMNGWEAAGIQQELQNLFVVATLPSPPPPPLIDSMPPSASKDVSLQSVDENQNNLSNANIDAGEQPETLMDWKKDFENKFGITIGMSENGKTFFYGEATVRVGPLDAAYGKELGLTYDKAMLNLRADFVQQTYGDFSSESIADFFENDSTNANEFTPAKLKEQAKQGKIGNMLDKAVDVLNNKIDKMLVEQGVAPSEIQKQTIEQKKTLFKDNFSKSMVKKSFASMSGLVPVQTKIITTDRNGKKTVYLGIIAVMSEKTIQFAKDSSRHKETLVKGKPSNIKDLLPNQENGYLDEVGLRYVYDNNGRPMLLSYGRWSVVGKTENASQYERKIQNAKEKARMFAESYIGEFMKSNIQTAQSVDADSISGEVAKKITEVENNIVSNEQESRDTIGETLDKSFKKLNSNSNFKLRGTSQVKIWEVTDENGILHVGSVVTWSYAQLENANNIVNAGKKKIEPIVQQQHKVIKYESRTSQVVNSTNDF